MRAEKKGDKLLPLTITLVSGVSSNSDPSIGKLFSLLENQTDRVTAQAEPESAELPASHRKRSSSHRARDNTIPKSHQHSP